METIIRCPETHSEWEAYYDLRYRIMREPLNQPVGSERNEGDSSGEHFALFENNIIKAIARLDKHSEGVAQVRFVAVETDVQGKGYGKKIMQATEKRALELGNHKMILHARDYALDFYTRLEYQTIEKSYKLFDVLQHFLMEKELK
jgi:predicted GNAT family N-acyltransferase